MLEPPLLDCAFDFKEISSKKISNSDTEIIEEFKKLPNDYKLSSLILAYLLKIYCLDKDSLYYKENFVVENSFGIVDTVRRKCGGEKYYLLPYSINQMATQLIEMQFGKVKHIFDVYKNTQRKENHIIIVSHESK